MLNYLLIIFGDRTSVCADIEKLEPSFYYWECILENSLAVPQIVTHRVIRWPGNSIPR